MMHVRGVERGLQLDNVICERACTRALYHVRGSMCARVCARCMRACVRVCVHACASVHGCLVTRAHACARMRHIPCPTSKTTSAKFTI